MNDQPKFYQSDLDANPARLGIAIFLCLVISIGLGFLYNLFSTFIPFIYFNVLITIGLGMAIGLIARIIARYCHLNTKKSRLILVVIMAMSTFVFQWIAYLSYFTNEGMIGFNLYLSNIPAVLFGGEYLGIISDLYEYGSWSIGSFLFKGFSLLLVWLFELGIIVVLPFMSVLKAKEFPYSNSLNRWYTKYSLSDQFESISSKRYFIEEYKDVYEAIQNLKFGEGFRHGKVHVFYLEQENKQYLSFEKIFYEGRGKGKMTSSYLIENFELSTQTARSILAEFNNSKERFEIF